MIMTSNMKTTSNGPNQTKPIKPNLPNKNTKTYQTKPNKSTKNYQNWQIQMCPELGTAQPQLVYLFFFKFCLPFFKWYIYAKILCLFSYKCQMPWEFVELCTKSKKENLFFGIHSFLRRLLWLEWDYWRKSFSSNKLFPQLWYLSNLSDKSMKR